MQLILNDTEISKLENRLSLRFDSRGIEYNGNVFSWEEIEEIKEQATRKMLPVSRLIKAQITRWLVA